MSQPLLDPTPRPYQLLPGVLATRTLHESAHFRVLELTGIVRQGTASEITLDSSSMLLLVLNKGSLLVRGPDADRWWTAPPRSLVLVNGPCVRQLRAARGEHQSYVVSWDKRAVAALSNWLQNHGTKGRQVFFGPSFGEFASVVDRLHDAIQTVGPALEPLVYGALHEIVARLAVSENRVGLTPIPSDLRESLARLVSMVRQKPEGQWPLKDAADLVGYSPFHFSRVFKTQVGYGFHEFVDRCRTEYAVNLICTTDMPIDVIATQSGFGTTQGLRESVKEYLGMVPSELRIDPPATVDND